MGLQHFNYFSWDTEDHRIISRGTFLRFFFLMKCRVKEEREGLKGMSPTSLDKWLKMATIDDTGLTRPPVVASVSAHKDEVRTIDHGYFQSQFRVTVYTEVDRP